MDEGVGRRRSGALDVLAALDELFDQTRDGSAEVGVKFSMEVGEEAIQSGNGQLARRRSARRIA